MRKILIFIMLSFSFPILCNNLQLAESYYDNRIPKKVYTYKNYSNTISLQKSTFYYKNGRKSYEVEYDRNGLNSRKTWWHNNGNKSKTITFKDGYIDGIWKTWNYQGQENLERLYKMGSMVSERKFKS